MKRRKLFSKIILSFFIVSLIIPFIDVPIVFAASLVEVSDTDYGYPLPWAYQQSSFYDEVNDQFFQFYWDDTSEAIYYESSQDFSTWGDKTFVNLADSQQGLTVAWNGTDCSWFFAGAIGYGEWQQGKSQADGTITWQGAKKTVQASTSKMGYPIMTYDSEGHVWIGFRGQFGSGNKWCGLLKNSKLDGTWSNDGNLMNKIDVLTGGGGNYYSPDAINRNPYAFSTPVALEDGWMYVIQGGDDIGGTNDETYGILWNGTDFVTGWEGIVTLDIDISPYSYEVYQFSASSDNMTVYYAWTDQAEALSPQVRMKTRTFDWDDTENYGSWDIKQGYYPGYEAVCEYPDEGASGGANPSISVDEITHDVYVWLTWQDDIGFYRKLGGAFWEDWYVVDTNPDATFSSTYTHNAFHSPTDEMISFSWLGDAGGGLDDVYHTYFNVSERREGNVTVIDFGIPNMEGCGNWVYAGEGKYYLFEAMLEVEFGFSVDGLSLQFSDGYHNMTVSYDNSTGLFSIDSGEEYIFLQQGTLELVETGVGAYYFNYTFPIQFRETVYDAYDIDVYYNLIIDGEVQGWEIAASEYFNIYSQGGLSVYGETDGADGKIPGDQAWEIYAGGQYFPSDIFEEHWQTGGINPGLWYVYDYGEGVLEDIHLVEIATDHSWYSPYATQNSLRIRAGDNPYDPYVTGYYDAGTESLYYFQTYVWNGDNTTGYTHVILNAVGRNDTDTWDAIICQLRFGYTTDFDGVYFDNSTDTYYSGYDYDVGGYWAVGWHNVTFAVDPASQTYIPYFDGNSLGNQTFCEPYSPNQIEFKSIYGTASRDSRFDAVKVWRDFEGGTGGTAWASTVFRKLQHLHFTLGFGTNDEGIFSFEDPDTNEDCGYIEIGMNVCSRQDTTDWYQQWKMRIEIADGLTNVDNNWVYLIITWFERNNTVKTDYLYAYYEGFQGDRDYFDMYVDLWFSNINSSRTIMGRINSKYFGITNVAPNWLKFITFGYWQTWGDMKTEESLCYFQSPLYNTTGSIHPAREIYITQPWVRVHRENPEDKYYNFQYYVRNHGLDFNHLPPNQEMVGIDEPLVIQTISLKGEQPNLLWQILGVMQSQLAPIWDALNWGGISMWSTFVDFLDTVFGLTGNPNAFSDFLALLDSFWGWFTTGLGWVITIVTDLFRLFAVTMTTGLDILGIFVTNWISLIQAITSVLGLGLQTGYDIWNDFQLYQFLELFSIMYFAWLVLYGMREGWDKVAIHLTFVFNVISFIIHLLLSLANFTITLVMSIIEAIPVVE